MDRPVIPDRSTLDPADAAAMKSWLDAVKAAFVWDAMQVGFTQQQAEFMYERYGARSSGSVI